MALRGDNPSVPIAWANGLDVAEIEHQGGAIAAGRGGWPPLFLSDSQQAERSAFLVRK